MSDNVDKIVKERFSKHLTTTSDETGRALTGDQPTSRPWPIAAIVAFFASGLFGVAAMYFQNKDAAYPRDASMKALSAAYDQGAGQLPVATEYLRNLVDVVLERQKSDRAAFDATREKFVALTKFDPELAAQMPQSLPSKPLS